MDATPNEEAELQELCDLSNAAAEQLQSPWEPLVVAFAFCRAGMHERHLTMQQWIDLHALRSPFLLGEIPQEVDGFLAAAQIMDLNVSSTTAPEDIAQLQGVILDACARAFATVLKMRPVKDTGGASYDDDGFGTWLPIYTCLVAELGLDPERALRMRVDQAFALIAALRHNQGQRVAGVPYAARGTENGPSESEDVTRG